MEILKLLEKDGFKILRISDWHTFDYREAKCGSAEVKKCVYERGLYLMEGVDGYDFFYVKKRINVTTLCVNGETVMVDDPLHYHGMRLLASASEGHVLTAGLGLGLYTIFLQQNPKVKTITVVEISEDVKNLILPMISKYITKPTKVVIDDIFNYLDKAKDYDTIMLDIWVSDQPNPAIFGEMMYAYKTFSNANPNAKVYIWGSRDPKINPASRGVSLKYVMFVNSVVRGGLYE